MRHAILDTFTGPFALVLLDDGSVRTNWVTSETATALRASRRDDLIMPDLQARLRSYFAGDDVDFRDVPLPQGGGFFNRCWSACRTITRGETWSYGALAARAGSAGAARAAGQAMRHNPLPIIVPCHRVVASSGRLHGFAGSCNAHGRELGIKAALLALENAHDRNEPRNPALNRVDSLYAQVV